MFKNHLKIAWRSLKKQPFFTFLNTFGLAIGIAGGLLISLYIHDELSYDTMFADANRIHRVHADIKFGGEDRKFAVAPAPMAEAVQNDFSEVVHGMPDMLFQGVPVIQSETLRFGEKVVG